MRSRGLTDGILRWCATLARAGGQRDTIVCRSPIGTGQLVASRRERKKSPLPSSRLTRRQLDPSRELHHAPRILYERCFITSGMSFSINLPFKKDLISIKPAQLRPQTHRISACTELPANRPAPACGIHLFTYSPTFLSTSSGVCGDAMHAAVNPVLPCCTVHHSPILCPDQASVPSHSVTDGRLTRLGLPLGCG